MTHPTRRSMLLATAALAAGCAHNSSDAPDTRIIDIHQHVNYSGRSDEELIAHQRAMGITHTVLLPAGQYVKRASTHNGTSNGLAAAILTFERARELCERDPKHWFFFANEVPDLPDARQSLERQLAAGAIGIGEQKFNVECDGAEIRMIAEIAAAHGVPVLLHFQHATYNKGYERFWRILDAFPTVNFIGHAQTFWANVDRAHADQTVLYPTTKVTPGGWTDRYLADYHNMYADMSAGSGLNAMLRDEEQAKTFIRRHAGKLLYGSDCNDKIGEGEKCSGSRQIATIRRLCDDPRIERKILFENARKLLGLPV